MRPVGHVSTSSNAAAASANGGSGARALRRHRGLPSGRAVAGGLLIAVACVGVFGAYRDASAPPRDTYVVAARRVALGTRLQPSDLRLVALDLPAALRRHAFADRHQLIGATVVGPVEAGELVQAGDVVRTAGRRGHQVSFAIEASRALDGVLVPGERVDVLSTYGGSGGDAFTSVVAADVVVANVRGAGSSLSSSRNLVLTLDVDTAGTVLAIVHAVRGGNVTLVRSDGTAKVGDTYQPRPARQAT